VNADVSREQREMAMTRAEHESKRDLAKCTTGIQGLDEITNGGLPKGRPTLIAGSAGCGKTMFGMQFLIEGARSGEPGVFVAFEEPVEELIANFKSLGYDLGLLENPQQICHPFIHVGEFSLQFPEPLLQSGHILTVGRESFQHALLHQSGIACEFFELVEEGGLEGTGG
jgi:hypothetical protein